MIQVGRQVRRVELYKPSTTKDDFGGQDVTYTLAFTMWASVSRVNGNRFLQNEQTTFNLPYSIRVRGYYDINEKDLLKYNGMDLIVSSVVTDERNFRWQNITATEKKP